MFRNTVVLVAFSILSLKSVCALSALRLLPPHGVTLVLWLSRLPRSHPGGPPQGAPVLKSALDQPAELQPTTCVSSVVSTKKESKTASTNSINSSVAPYNGASLAFLMALVRGAPGSQLFSRALQATPVFIQWIIHL